MGRDRMCCTPFRKSHELPPVFKRVFIYFLTFVDRSGQNPTGCTLSVERRKRIYALCQRYDIMIIEDDPYYYLQYVDDESSEDLLMPSFLSMDVDGRVFRVDRYVLIK